MKLFKALKKDFFLIIPARLLILILLTITAFSINSKGEESLQNKVNPKRPAKISADPDATTALPTGYPQKLDSTLNPHQPQDNKSLNSLRESREKTNIPDKSKANKVDILDNKLQTILKSDPHVQLIEQDPSALDWGYEGIFEGFSPEDEIISRRDKTSKHFLSNNGDFKAVIAAHGSALHYKADGHWRTIKRDIKINDSGNNPEYAYFNPDNSFQSYYPEFSTGGIRTDYSEGPINEWENPRLISLGPGNTPFSVFSINEVQGILGGDNILYPEAYPGTDVRISQTAVGRHIDMIIRDSAGIPELPPQSPGFAYVEDIYLPDGWYIEVYNCGSDVDRVTGFSIFDHKGAEIARYHQPYIYEQYPPCHPDFDPGLPKEEQKLGDWNHRMDTDGYYHLIKTGNILLVYTIIPYHWITASDRVFPVIVDPTYTAYPISHTCNTGSCSNTSYTQTSLVKGYDTEDGWFDFYVNSIPDGATITVVELNFYVYATYYPYWNANPVSATGWNFTSWCGNTSYSAWYDDITAEDYSGYYLYQSESSDYTTGWKSHTLGGTVNSDCANALVGAGGYTTDYFSTGHSCRDNSPTYYINVEGWNETNRPYLIITYSTGGCTPDFYVTAPGTWNGSTCSAGDDCALRSTEDHIYQVTIPSDGSWKFSLCGSSYDTYIFIGTTCCGQEIGYNDDDCGGTLQSSFTTTISAGTYYVTIEGYSSCGSYILEINPASSTLTCPVGSIFGQNVHTLSEIWSAARDGAQQIARATHA
ncbi:hypothetical protein JW877_10250, partial [bacterium]|nr:hypothetical protein [bacterium]